MTLRPPPTEPLRSAPPEAPAAAALPPSPGVIDVALPSASTRLIPPPAQPTPARPPSFLHSAWAMLRLMRPKQWTKNLAAFAGVTFGGHLHNVGAIGLDALVALLFIPAAAAVYVFNDACDAPLDRRHPRKRNRPIASGRVSIGAALPLSLGLVVCALGGSWLLHPRVFACVASYLILNLLYARWLKHVPLVDGFCIAAGYVLRVMAGVYVLGDIPTGWIILCTFFLSLFLAYAKRRAELMAVTDAAGSVEHQRPVLRRYNVALLDSLLNNTAVMTVSAYALFTTTSRPHASLVVTVPIVFFAVMHYRRRLALDGAGEEPDEMLLKDPWIIASIIAFLVVFVLIDTSKIVIFV